MAPTVHWISGTNGTLMVYSMRISEEQRNRCVEAGQKHCKNWRPKFIETNIMRPESLGYIQGQI